MGSGDACIQLRIWGVAVCCSVLQCIAVRSQEDVRIQARIKGVTACCSVLQCVAVCCTVLQYGLKRISIYSTEVDQDSDRLHLI